VQDFAAACLVFAVFLESIRKSRQTQQGTHGALSISKECGFSVTCQTTTTAKSSKEGPLDCGCKQHRVGYAQSEIDYLCRSKLRPVQQTMLAVL